MLSCKPPVVSAQSCTHFARKHCWAWSYLHPPEAAGRHSSVPEPTKATSRGLTAPVQASCSLQLPGLSWQRSWEVSWVSAHWLSSERSRLGTGVPWWVLFLGEESIAHSLSSPQLSWSFTKDFFVKCINISILLSPPLPLSSFKNWNIPCLQ